MTTEEKCTTDAKKIAQKIAEIIKEVTGKPYPIPTNPDGIFIWIQNTEDQNSLTAMGWLNLERIVQHIWQLRDTAIGIRHSGEPQHAE